MKGILNLVSVGPGFSDLIVPRAEAALRDSDVIVAYDLYLRWIEPWITGKEIHTPPLTQERERALLAIEKARSGAKVALISSGDIGIYAMAALAFDEMREDDDYAVNVIPGITSANACASLLGSPLSHDFATLSLSDLLCPWDWIEQRGRHIAQADLACVLYNVQSAGRQEGVYRILNIMLESKSPKTLCGVIHNAYRPGQKVSIHHLEDLLSLQFDMLTTIVIGNRFTQRKRGFIFTPRGYNNWDAPDVGEIPCGCPDLPEQALWVFSGTSDGNALANELAQQGYPVVVSAATEYGGEVAAQHCPGVSVWAGHQGVEARKQALSQNQARVIVDATHPYAKLISEQLMGLSKSLNIPYLRYERPSSVGCAEHSEAHLSDSDALPSSAHPTCSLEQAAEQAIKLGRRIFLTTGSKDLAAFLNAPGAAEREWFVRVTPEPEFIQRAIDLGVPRSHICAMQGPFSEAFNTALWRDLKIDCVITKDSGDAGGYQAKVAATQALNIPLLVIKRPKLEYPFTTSSFDAALSQLQAWHVTP
ncbi:precorrin-3B C(17)-methyltransferase [Methylobacter tundripaludum]|uniref:Precorrin-3B C17-methyltransferase n=1 Tax=Methylobacter tundripaludum (strain ATCC BAA-1195 / DSM 17260 / SV96) TaxID=697282 RepID=G3J1R0_METTV|nr:precorrin-3B C(17)-methyltransferase [Methylobacter tundripaludum]EGW19666.1 precorrin-3B C17-methyltransferase [Methylobacter tundripaludum SV96]